MLDLTLLGINSKFKGKSLTHKYFLSDEDLFRVIKVKNSFMLHTLTRK